MLVQAAMDWERKAFNQTRALAAHGAKGSEPRADKDMILPSDFKSEVVEGNEGVVAELAALTAQLAQLEAQLKSCAKKQ